ncbi:hypothetical protein D7X55_16845 [Corallococcus sp. AB049A]|uniref:Uncharacterized protein n=1 Tax=Corallococcus interemptor TaxID=2316720 RepID=A0A3A8QBA6_9BACT|nr:MULTISPECIES: hypothetical protein [Corallococcus]RKH41749.1 hypothetical protein D7Y23_32405 [Corallococcus sp. AB050B]RKH65448.1 hypothetical protein D7X96_23635 [Corallococcus interemptor]RKI65118.1 hypothetical protein D7X55_16845 [Corallococcus sp. AB049A]
MSREENNRYLREATHSQPSKLPVLGWLVPRPLLKILFWAVLLGLWASFYVFFTTPSPTSEGGNESISTPAPRSVMEHKLFPYLLVIVPAIAGSLALRQFRIRKVRRKEANALQQPGPEAHLRLTDELLPPTSPFPDANLLRAQRRALARILYGQDAQARYELNAVDWRGKAPLLQAMERGSDALRHLLCKDDPEQARMLAREALSLADINPAIPGARQGRVFYEALVQASELVTGPSTPEDLRTLEHHQAQSSLLVVRLISAWALRAAATQRNDPEGAERMRQFLQTHAPHCAALHRLPARAMAKA